MENIIKDTITIGYPNRIKAKLITPEELAEITETHKLHHTAYVKGYVPRNTYGYIAPYKGRFGEGYALYESNKRSANYSWITYYIRKKEDEE